MASSQVYDKLRGEINRMFKEGDNLVEGDEFWLGLIADSEEPKRVLEIAKDMKEEGNSLFKLGKFENALEIYGYAEAILGRYQFQEEAHKSEFCELALCILLNSTACFSKLKEFVQVGQLCSIILEFQPNNVKAIYRRAIAAMELGRYDMAYWYLVFAAGINPNNQEVTKKLEEGKGFIKSKKSEKQNQGDCPKGLGLGLPPPKTKPDNEVDKFYPSKQDKLHGLDSTTVSSEEDKGLVNTAAQQEGDLGMHDGNMEGSPMVSEKASSITSIEGQEEENAVIQDKKIVDKSSLENDDDANESNVCSNEEIGSSILAKPKYQFQHRRKHDSNFTISKSDYHLMTKGKTLKYFNASTYTFMEIRIAARVEEDHSKEHGDQPSTLKDMEDTEDSLVASSEAHSCVTSEDEQGNCVESNSQPKDGNESASQNMEQSFFCFSANHRYAARKKRDDAKMKTHGPPISPAKNNKRRKLLETEYAPLSTTNLCCGCRYYPGMKRKSIHPVPMDSYHLPRKRERIAPLPMYSAYVGTKEFVMNSNLSEESTISVEKQLQAGS